MELRKRITVLVPSELVYAFDPDHEHIFIAAREKGRIVARPMEEAAMSGTRTRGHKVYNNGYASGIYHDQYDEERLLAQLGKVDPLAIYRGGQASGLSMAGYKRYLYQVLQIYNGSSLKYALPLKF